MRKLLVFIALCSLVCSATAQKLTKRPVFRPDWVYEAPRPTNGTYLYVVEHGEGNTKREALNLALARVFQSTANRIGQTISTSEMNKALQSGTEFEVVASKMKVPVYKVCEFPVQDTLTNSWTMYVLCQVAKAGNITPEFEPTDECTKRTHYDKLKKQWDNQQQAEEDAIKKAQSDRNTTALIASTIIPGTGQMLKGHVGTGAAFLVGELAIFGGGTACHFLGQEQVKIMKSTGVSYADYQQAKSTKNTLDIAMFTCFGVGALVHVGNMVHAWFATDKRAPLNYTFVPTLIPTNEYSNPNYAMGAGVQINF